MPISHWFSNFTIRWNQLGSFASDCSLGSTRRNSDLIFLGCNLVRDYETLPQVILSAANFKSNFLKNCHSFLPPLQMAVFWILTEAEVVCFLLSHLFASLSLWSGVLGQEPRLSYLMSVGKCSPINDNFKEESKPRELRSVTGLWWKQTGGLLRLSCGCCCLCSHWERRGVVLLPVCLV